MNNIENFRNVKGYEVLLYISDQHTADCAGFMGDPIVRTPNLDAIAKESFVFRNAYTSCPLCVPARASMMTGRYASNLSVFGNDSDFRSSDITFAHSFALAGYDSNLIGRMHFVGMDYFHGFTRRIGLDMTSSYWGMLSEDRDDLGDFGRSLYQKHCLEVVGSGDSPVLSYDREIVELALDFYSKDYKKPQMTVVGTYAPHFPYVASEEKMAYYRDYFASEYRDEIEFFDLEPVDKKVQITTKEDIIELRSAYYAMVETMDEQIGAVYNAYQNYLKRNNKKGIFIYMSDHGDQLGCMGIYGKQTFFEKSAKIPFIMKVDNFEGGDVNDAVSIMDIAPSLCQLCNTEEIPLCEGKSFVSLMGGIQDPERYMISEYYDSQIKACQRGYMVFQNGYKYIYYEGYEDKEMLFDLRESKDERVNVAKDNPEILEKMRNILKNDPYIKDYTKEYLESKARYKFLAKVGSMQHYQNIYTYSPPKESRFIKDEFKRPHREW